MERRRTNVGLDDPGVATLTLMQLVDLSLNFPEVGMVRLNLLQSLLHAIIRTLGICDVQVQFDVEAVVMKPDTDVDTTSDVLGYGPRQRRKSSLKYTLDQDTVADLQGLQSFGARSKRASLTGQGLESDIITEEGHEPSELPRPRKFSIGSDLDASMSGISRRSISRGSVSVVPEVGMIMPVATMFDIIPNPGTLTFFGLREKVTDLESRFEKMLSPPSNEDLLSIAADKLSKSGSLTNMWDNMQLMRKVEANSCGLEQLLSVVNDLVQESKEHWKQFESIKQQLDNLSKIINREMEMPSFVKWSNLEEILKGIRLSSVDTRGPSEALQSHLVTIGNLDQSVTELGGKCQELDDKVQGHEFTLNILTPEVKNLKTTVISTTDEINNLMKIKKKSGSGSDKVDGSESTSDLALSVRELFNFTDEKIEQMNECQNLSCAIIEDRLKALEDGLLALKAGDIDLPFFSDVPISSSGQDEENLQDEELFQTDLRASSREDEVGKPTTVDMKEMNKAFKQQNSLTKQKMQEFQTKLKHITDQMSKLQSSISYDETDESCLKLLKKSVENLQRDVERVTAMSEETLQLTARVQQLEVDKDDLVVNVLDVKENSKQLQNMINEFQDKLDTSEAKWNHSLDATNDKLNISIQQTSVQMVSLRKDIHCHLQKLSNEVTRLNLSLSDIGDDGAATRKKLKFQCLSCDRKLIISPLDPPPDTCIASAPSFQASRSTHPYTSYEIENIRSKQQSSYMMPKQVTHFQRAILERHMARLRMRDFRAYFMQCWNDLPEMKATKSNECRTLYDMEMELPDVYGQLKRFSGGPHPPQSSYNSMKGAQYVDVLNVSRVPSVKQKSDSHNASTSKPESTNRRLGPTRLHQGRTNKQHGKLTVNCKPLMASSDTDSVGKRTSPCPSLTENSKSSAVVN